MFFLVYVFSLCVYTFSYAVADESATEATAPCLDGLLCADSDPSLSRLVESIPEAPCPKFIIEQQVLRDSKSSLTTDSPDEICSTGVANSMNHFKNASELESYLRQSPHFSDLNQASIPFSICLSQGVSVPVGLGKTSVALSKETLPENKKKLAVAEYYSSLRRLSDGVERSVQNITAIDLMIGNSLLSDVSCNSLDSISTVQAGQCRSIKQCPISANNNSQLMRESAQDTLLALQGIEAIEKERLRLVAERGKLGGSINQHRNQRRVNPNQQKIEELTGQIRELEERKQNLQNLYPWVLGKKFKDSYRAEDYANYANSSEAGKREMEAQVAGLIREQLNHTRAKLKERKEDFIKASSCIKKEESFCEELDISKILAKAPPINHTEIFERDRREELKNKMKEEGLTLEERTEYRRLLTQVGEADGLFSLVNCLQTQRKAVKDVNRELALGALDVGIVVGTMGLGSAAIAGRLALRMGSALSKAEKLSKAKRLQNLGIFGTDVSLSAPYMQEAMNICEAQINQLEEMQNTEQTANAQQTANTEQTTNAEQTANKNKDCKNLPVRAKHTSDVKACILQASLASLPITLPILGLSGMALAKKLRSTPSTPAPPSSSAQRAEEVLESKLNPAQRRAIEEAHLVGQGERGRNGAIAGIGNYTEDQLRRKAEILRRAGFSKKQRRTLMETGVVGDDLLIRAGKELEEDLQAIRASPQEPGLKAQGFKPEYYAGFDQARESNAVARYLRTINADPKKTHIPYFADQIDKTISDFEQAFRKHNQDNPEFLEERLAILEEIKKEAQKRIKDQNVTYDWWTNFNLRLPMITSESDFLQIILQMRNRKKLHNLNDPTVREEAGIEVAYNKEFAQKIEEVMRSYPERRKKLRLFQRLQTEFEQLNPEEILIDGTYTSQELERILFNLADSNTNINFRDHTLTKIAKEKGLYNNNIDNLKTHEDMEDIQEVLSNIAHKNLSMIGYLIDMPPFIRAKENFPEEIMFFTTDELGIMAFNKLEDKSYFVGVSGRPRTADGSKLNAFEFSNHDLFHIGEQQKMQMKGHQRILERIANISNPSDRETAEWALFMYRHEVGPTVYAQKLRKYYTSAETHLSQSELRQLRVDIKKVTQEMMNNDDITSRFFDPDDLQGMLPNSVNVNNEEEIRKFLNESADVFADILLAP